MGHRAGQVQAQVKIRGEPVERTERREAQHPGFKLVFFTVVGITLFAGTAEIIIAAVWTTRLRISNRLLRPLASRGRLGLVRSLDC